MLLSNEAAKEQLTSFLIINEIQVEEKKPKIVDQFLLLVNQKTKKI